MNDEFVGRVSPPNLADVSENIEGCAVGLRCTNLTYGTEWLSFTDLLSAIVDNRGRTCPVGNTGIPLIATNCVDRSNLYPSYDTTRFVSEETYNTWFRGHPLPGDILFVCKGSPGRTNWVPDPVDFCIAQDMVAVRADPNKIYPKYLFAALRSSVVQTQIDNMHVGTMIPHFKKGDFGKLNIPVPSPDAQKIIGDFYFTLSERIALLRETNATLEGIAQALFKSWFVDFDPVHAKQQGIAPAGMDETTAALFPDGFETSELGLVPRGWKVGTLGDIAKTEKKQIQPSELHAELHYVGLEHIPRKSLSLTDWGNAEGLESAKAKFAKGDILFGKLRPYFHKVVIAPFDGVCSTDILVCQSKNPACFALVVMQLFSKTLIDYAERLSNGAKMPRVNWTDLANYPICIPPEALAAHYNEILSPIISAMTENAHRCATLATLRDTLLPRLISGQLRLSVATLDEVKV